VTTDEQRQIIALEKELAELHDEITALKSDLRMSHAMIADQDKELEQLRRLKDLTSQNQPFRLGDTLLFKTYEDYLLSLDNTDKSDQT
jgi:septal ring factor EnvC (AmiA/AmiB activator)